MADPARHETTINRVPLRRAVSGRAADRHRVPAPGHKPRAADDALRPGREVDLHHDRRAARDPPCTKSLSRPRTSNDNPYSEAALKIAKGPTDYRCASLTSRRHARGCAASPTSTTTPATTRCGLPAPRRRPRRPCRRHRRRPPDRPQRRLGGPPRAVPPTKSPRRGPIQPRRGSTSPPSKRRTEDHRQPGNDTLRHEPAPLHGDSRY